ncbi:MAG: SAM-dependent methyltransferase [Pseudomonadota bacterium]
MKPQTSSRPPALFDRDALARRRRRAIDRNAMFLHDEAAAELQERLKEVNRAFTTPAVVSGFPTLWRQFFPEIRSVRDDDVLDLEPRSHDLVLHAMCLHWSNDPVGHVVQCRHALRPDGLFLAVFPGGETLRELRDVLGRAETEVLGGMSPRIAPMIALRDAGAFLQRAGLALPVADSVPRGASYASLWALMHDLRAMGETNVLVARHKRTPPRDLFEAAARIYRDEYGNIERRIHASFELIFLTGWAPDPSQQQPLQPGSARIRLADALGTTEFDEHAKPVNDRDQT